MDIGKKHARLNKNSPLWLSSLIGGSIGLCVIAVCAFLFPLLILKTSEPSSLITVFGVLSVFLGGAVAGFLSASRSRSFGAGMLSAAVILAPMLIISLFSMGAVDWIETLSILFALGISSALGAYIATLNGKNRKKNMKKAMKRRRS